MSFGSLVLEKRLRFGMVRLGAIGLGNRACKYLKYLELDREAAQLVAVADPDGFRRARVAAEFGVGERYVFASAEELFGSDAGLDAVIIASPDATHYPFAMAALAKGWHVLLEKPAALSLGDCLAMEKSAAEKNLTVSVCYVLRFHPLYLRLKEIAGAGDLGHIVSVHHILNVGLDRMTHTFVRGLWSREEDSSPIILSKASHDVDILCWIAGEKAVRVYSEGSLGLFTSRNAPDASSERCVDCPLERQCRFSAVDLYLRRDEWNNGFDVLPSETKADAVLRELHSGRYGRCVFRCGNDVLDRQSVRMVLESGAEVLLEMDGRSDKDSRETTFIFEKGTVRTDGRNITVWRADTGASEGYDMSGCCGGPLHSGADMAVVKDFMDAVGGRDRLHGADISSALHSHQVCFLAEESRRTGKPVCISL